MNPLQDGPLASCCPSHHCTKGKLCSALMCVVILWLCEHPIVKVGFYSCWGSLTDAFKVLWCTLDKSSIHQKCTSCFVIFPLPYCITLIFVKLSHWLLYPFLKPFLLVLFSPTAQKIQGKLWLSVSRFLSRERSCLGDTKCQTKITFSSSKTNTDMRMMHS